MTYTLTSKNQTTYQTGSDKLLTEDGFHILTEDGQKINLEPDTSSSPDKNQTSYTNATKNTT